MYAIFVPFLGLRGKSMIETMTKDMIGDEIEAEKEEGKTTLTDMVIGDLIITATVGVMRMTVTIEIIRGRFIWLAYDIRVIVKSCNNTYSLIFTLYLVLVKVGLLYNAHIYVSVLLH
jgi:hypothetical protein